MSKGTRLDAPTVEHQWLIWNVPLGYSKFRYLKDFYIRMPTRPFFYIYRKDYIKRRCKRICARFLSFHVEIIVVCPI